MGDDLFNRTQNGFIERERAKRGEAAAGEPTFEVLLPARRRIIYLLEQSAPDDECSRAWYLRIAKAINFPLDRQGVRDDDEDDNPPLSMREYLENETDPEKFLNAVELLFGSLKDLANLRRSKRYCYTVERPDPAPVSADKAAENLNAVFQRDNIGYRFENGQIIRTDSLVVHAEIVHPALALLVDPRYAHANAAYMKAHERYRSNDYPGCVVECRKAFESVMKLICAKRGWSASDADDATAKTLINICLRNRLVPSIHENQLDALSKVLGASTLASNKPGGAHGEGVAASPMSQQLALYTLHLTAANILFFIRSEVALG